MNQYPVEFSVTYPDRELNRLTTFFRIFVAIPILIVLGAVDGGGNYTSHAGHYSWSFAAGAGGILLFGPLLIAAGVGMLLGILWKRS